MADQNNPYADFGGSVATPAPSAAPQPPPTSAPQTPPDPYAEFGGQTAPQPKPPAQTVGDVTGDPTHILQDGKIVPIVKQALTSANTVGGIINNQDAGAAKGTQYEGYAKIGGALLGGITDHIMAGSPIEKLIQKANPNFHGTGPQYNARNILTNGTPLAGKTTGNDGPNVFTAPIVDAAQFIDKKSHPIGKAVAEVAQSLTSPESVGVLAATGGLGLVENPTALATANRLLSAGFSAQSIGEAYKNSKAFKAAYDKGEGDEAMYQLTHLVLNGAVAVMAGQHATGVKPTPSTAIGQKAGDAVANVPTVIKNAASNAADAVTAAPKKIISTASDTAEAIKPEWLTQRPETPSPQHGVPVRVESPLDSATVGKQIGGKDLSQEALDALQQHVGSDIPVGSSAKNRLVASVEPVARTINETASKMNDIVKDAPKFTTSVMQDNVFGDAKFTDEIDSLKKNIPPSVREGLSADVDDVMKDADKALNSIDPQEILEYRRQLGKQIDWDDIQKNPTTPKEVQNAARAKVYRAIGEKIHTDIPDTVELDKILQPNLELRSHLQRKVGERLVDDPHAATVEAQSEFKKGETTVKNNLHNEEVVKNWNRVKVGLVALGVTGGVIHEIDKLLGL
jgi:hypothetical protein